jgi:hypothetical protein
MIMLRFMLRLMQHFIRAAAIALEQRGCPLGGDLVLFSDGTTFVVVPIPEYGKRTPRKHLPDLEAK